MVDDTHTGDQAEASSSNNRSDDKEKAGRKNVQMIDLDTVLVKEIGEFGNFQLKTLLLAATVVIFTAWGAAEYVFTTARIPTRCRIPECDGDNPEWSPYWLSNAVPAVGPYSFDNCHRFVGNVSATKKIVESMTCPSELFDRERIKDCEEYVYENTHTVAYDFDLACHEWSRSLIGTVRTFGTFTALPITGFVSDRWGRRVALTLNAFNTGWLGLVRYWADTYIGFMMSQFVEATLGSGTFSSVYILLMEVIGPKYRVAAGAAMNTTFSIGQVLMGLIAWGVPNWRYLTLALYAPQLLTLSYFWLMSESVRWYMSKGRFEESEKLLKKIASTNGKTLSEKSLQSLRYTSERMEVYRTLAEERRAQDPWIIVQVFKHKRVLLTCVVSPLWWITSNFIYYGLSINAIHISGNSYINFIAVAAVEIPGCWAAMYLMGKIGRKPVLIGAFWMCSVCQFTYVFLPPSTLAMSLTVYLLAKCCIAMVVVATYVYTAELYPTKARHTLFAFSSMMGRIGSMVAPLTPAIGTQFYKELPFVLFGTFAFVSGALIFLTPETHNLNLPDTFEQADRLGLKDNNQNKPRQGSS